MNHGVSSIRTHRLPLVFFLAAIFVLLFAAAAQAHDVGQPSFFKIDGQLAGYYDELFFSPFFDIPQDKAPEDYLVNQDLDFEIDTVPLQVSLDVLKQTTFHWDFGDGTTALGLKNTHRYTRPGSYVVNITSTYGSNRPQLIESALVQVLPSKDYQLPNAVILVNGEQVPDIVLPFDKPVLFDATRSVASSPIVSYTWDFNDQTSGSQPVIQHQYAQHTDWQMAFVLLRVKDEQGFFSDTYVEVINQDVQGQGVLPPSLGQSITPQPSTKPGPPANQGFIARIVAQINTLSRNLIDSVLDAKTGGLLALAFLLVLLAGGLHALTPGHGKSIMAVFLGGKKGSSFNDVFLLAGSITFTHTIVIFLLGFIFLFVDQRHSLNDTLPYFEKIGALIVAILAFNLIRNGWHNLRHHDRHDHDHDHDHGHEHAHAHPHPHPHDSSANASSGHPGPGAGRKSVLFAGFAGGIVPCSDAFALLLLLVSAGKVLLGIVFVLVFSVGLAGAIVLLGLLLVIGKRSFDLEGKLGRAAETYAPLISGVLLAIISLRLLL